MVATTYRGLEQILAGELYSIGAQNVEILNRAVSFSGDNILLYTANIYLRTALRILKPIHHFIASDEEVLYRHLYNVEWEKYLRTDQTFAIDSAVHSDVFRHSKYVALKMKDAIADRFRDKYGIRPSVDVHKPDIRLNLHINGTHVDISLDSSGEPLFKRGYRSAQHEAPLNEVLAAGLILLAGWDKLSGFFDPMCGSGTLPIEAGLMSYNIVPGLIRKEFAFQNWPDYDKHLYRQIILQAQAEVKNDRVFIDGSDIDKTYIRMAEVNAKNAMLDNKINFFIKPFEICDPPPSSSMIIMNPPYGVRIGGEKIADFYKKIGDTIKNKYTNKIVWLLSSNMEAIKHIGLKPSKKITIFNGPLECKFLMFEVYAGTKKNNKTQSI